MFPLKIQFKPTPGQQEPILTLSAQRLTPELEALLRRLERECPPPISGWQGDRVTPLEHHDLLRCYTAGQKVLAQTLDGLEHAPLEPPWRATGPEPCVSFSLWKFQRLMTPA